MEKPYRRRLPIHGMSEADDRLLAMIVALTSEVTVLRERLDTMERVLGDRDVLPSGAIEGYNPDADALTARDTLRQRIIAKVMKPLRDAAARDADMTKQKALKDRQGDA